MNIIWGIIGIAVTFFLAWIASSDKKLAFRKWKQILLLLGLQLAFAFLILSTGGGRKVVDGLAFGFGKLLEYAGVGTSFVFGPLLVDANGDGQFVFFFNVLIPIIVVSALIGILQYFKILPAIIHGLGWILSKITGMPFIESYNGAASMFLGQSEVFVSLKNQVPLLGEQRLYTLAAQAMSSISLSMVAAYMTLLQPEYVITAIVLNLFSVYIIIHIINPYDVPEEVNYTASESNPDQGKSFFQILSDYILQGALIAVIVAAMLIAFNALIAILNNLFLAIPGSVFTFQDILGYTLMPLAVLIGVPVAEAHEVGILMATKLVTNEFVAMENLQAIKDTFGPRTQAMVSVFLVSFANFGSIGIIVGTVKGIHAKSGDLIAKFGLKLVYGASLVSVLSAVIVGFFVR
ncbi:NupC/NupG family nucleoside CNT transporter [Nosocomiicoccus ampullae]|uniref:NupC/NupG family nucleoside CNT transporter n=1 Tax=Nosocomiicoccus ampullae TaxID=489910 RepID=UPI00254EAFF6|nr:nucleoside transporter C-terminal domain-containing protein [Nosocomiicoccus ampullae]MDK6863670.1 nucleoside transporter C-terminal domain-containing protein [Nosocomiicoccus ampullae]